MINEIEICLERFFSSFYNLYRNDYAKLVDILLRAYDERGTNGLSGIDNLLVKNLAKIINTLRLIKVDTLNKMKEFILNHCTEYHSIYVIDCLGLPELYALWCEASKLGLIPILRVFINTRANTRAFKEVFGVESLRQVAERAGGLAYRRLDELLHHKRWLAIFSGTTSREEFMRLLIDRINYLLSIRSLLVRSGTMILTDHGYDIVCINTRYIAEHSHIPKSKLALAKLASVLLLKRPG